MFYISDENERYRERLAEDLQTNSGYVSASELHSLKSLDFCDTPELDLYSSTPKTSRSAHKRKNRSKRLRQQKSSGKETAPYNHNGLISTVFDSETEAAETYRSSNPYGLSKSLTKTRNSERNLKQFNNHGRFLDGVESSSGPSSLPPIVVTSQKYKCLDSMPVCKITTDEDSSLKTCPPRFTNASSPFFGSDRVSFYKNFSLLIDLGKSRDKDMRRHACNRQMSSEEELWRSQFGDIAWLELQAHLNHVLPYQQDAFFMRCRENIPTMIDRLLSFRVFSSESSPSLIMDLPRPDSCTCCNIPDDDLIPSAENMFGTCPGQILKLFCDASAQSVAMMKTLDYIASLYPTQKALLKGCPTYGTEEVQGRISSFYLWLNISRDLFQQLKSILDLVTFSLYKECSLWSCINPLRINYILKNFGRSSDALKENMLSMDISMSENNEDSNMELEVENGEKYFDEDAEDETNGCDAEEEEEDDDESIDHDARSEGNTLAQPLKIVTFESDFMSGFGGSRLLSKSSITSADSLETIPTSTTSIYRHYVDRNLKRTGMRKFCNRLRQMMDKTLSKTQEALNFMGTPINKSQGKTIRHYMLEMGLPSFSCIYHFLCHVPLDIIHECLKLRLERQPKKEPSLYILRTLVHECKEVLSSTINWKHYYLKLISSVQCTSFHEAEMEKLEDDLMKMLQVYFNHMQQFMNELQQLPEMSKELKNFLEKEWNFMKICSSIRNGEAYAGNRFCAMASSLIRSISEFLDSRIDECINQFFTNSALESLITGEPTRSKSSEFRQCMVQLGRDLKLHFNEARERSYKALAFAKMLKKDLEMAAQYEANAPLKVILESLWASDHVQIVFPEKLNYLCLVPKSISCNKYYISRLLSNVSSECEGPLHDFESSDFPGYVVLTKVDNVDSLVWNGERVVFESTSEATISLDHLEQINGWLLLAMHSLKLATSRKIFEDLVGDHLLLKTEQMSCHRSISNSLNYLKTCALDLRVRIVDGLSHIIEKLGDAELVDVEESEKNIVLKSNKETINYCFTSAFEYHKELLRLISGDMKGDLSRAMIEFARRWMDFAHTCDRGRGVKPRWASHGFEFLKISCEPKNLEYLNDDEFNTLTRDINCCISHVIGTKPTGCSPDVIHNKSLKSISLSSRRSYASPSRSISNNSNNSNNSSNVISSASSCSVLKSSLADLSVDGLTEGINALRRNSRQQRGVMSAINDLDKERNETLMKSKVIGQVSNARPDVDSAVRMRRVKFKWQRGIKIGEGQFGKVYIAINLDNDVLMAMKEIKLQPNDHQAIRKIDEEIKTFEGIKHQSLVQYFGVEMYRDEMIIFMEYCQNGTIEDLAKQGLDEHMIRKYSNEILQAIYILHSHDIVHRDIKGANIFLMPNNSIKLGDFGCSVKLKSHTTMAGELNEYVGTPAFMAPEVIRGNALKGYGRAADIWSFGCVIIQMTTGTRPWPELESKIQIFFKVGSGAVPQIPEVLSEEGKEFLGHCLETDDEKRWTAEQLIDHPFTKISEDDDLEN